MSGLGPKTAPTYKAPAPANYVAGIGRGAMGFTTRSDIGPARPAASTPGVPAADPWGQAPPGYVAGRGRGMGDLAKQQGEVHGAAPAAEVDRMDYSESNYDEFAGYSERLFSSSAYEEDDAEADQIYQAVDDAMESRRKRAREKQLLEEQKRQKTERLRIADQFADLKRELGTVTAEQWDAIPDVGDHSLKYKQSRKKESFMPVPDSVLLLGAGAGSGLGGLLGGGTERAVDPTDGTASTLSRSVIPNSQAMLTKLDRISDSVGGQTVVDPRGYLTSLNSIKISSEAEIGDIKKARVLLQSVTSTNPAHGPGWIAAARVEEYANKAQAARKVILEGCEKAPQSEDVWLEAARLNPVDKAKIILNNAIRVLPLSVKIYLQLASYETATDKKKAILRKGLESIPNSVTLWKAAIELESVNDAKILLSRAIECIPSNLDMYLALAKLETHANARKVLNKARENIPTEKKVWIYAATLEEVNLNNNLVPKIIEKMMFSLEQYQVTIKREDWISEAIECERIGAVLTCHTIVKHTIHLQLDPIDYKKIWLDDINHCLYSVNNVNNAGKNSSGAAIETARAICNVAVEHFPNKKSIWLQAILIEQEFGTIDTLVTTLEDATKAVPYAEIIWLIYAKLMWKQNEVDKARSVLMQAYEHNPNSEQVYLAAVKLEWENSELQRTRLLLSKAKEVIGTAKIYMKFALFEIEQEEFNSAVALLEEGIAKFNTFEKFYLMLAQIQENTFKDLAKARQTLQIGLKACPQCVPLWHHLILLEEKDKGGVVKARSIGEMARLKIPKKDSVYIECMRLEKRNGYDKLYSNLAAKALVDCPTSGLLWSEMLMNIPKNQYKSKAIEALKKVPNNEHVLLTIARMFERVYVYRKAYKYYERALTVNNKLGDVYVYYFACVYVQEYKTLLLESNNKGGYYEELIRESEKAEEEEGGSSGNSNSNKLVMEGVDDEEDDEPENKESNKESSADDMEDGGVKKSAFLVGLIKRCEAAEPNAGEVWNSFSKQTHMRRKSVREKLVKCVESVLGFELIPNCC